MLVLSASSSGRVDACAAQVQVRGLLDQVVTKLGAHSANQERGDACGADGTAVRLR
jgi:hypothetical protein